MAGIWLTPTWRDHGKKHRPGNIEWRKLVKASVPPEGTSFYHPSISEAEQQSLELDCVVNGTILSEVAGKRTFYIDAKRVVGAADGAEVEFVFAEWAMCGTVHGRPMSRKELRRRGANL